MRLVSVFDGYDVRMYADARAMWRGLLKSASAIDRRPPVAAAAATAVWLAPLALASSRRRSTRRLAAGVLAAQVGADLAARVVARQPALPALGAPVSDLALLALRSHAAVLRRRGSSVQWRGRDVSPG